jgi:hypothetical protein
MSSDVAPNPAPFWYRLNTFFLFPLQPQPLIYAVFLSLCSLLVKVFPFGLAYAFIFIGLLLAMSRYAFRVIAVGSRGISKAADFPRELDPDWAALPWKLFGIIVVKFFFIGVLEHLSPGLGLIGLFVVCFTLPASMMVLVETCSFWEALNPSGIWGTIRIVGWSYVLLCLFLFLLTGGSEVAFSMLLPIFSGIILVPIGVFVSIYFYWVMASLLGYVMYQNHEAFGIHLLPGAGVEGATVRQRNPEQLAQDAVDAQVSLLITNGDMATAVATAYEDQRSKPHDLVPQRRYHQVLLLAEKTSSLLEHATRFIPLLLRYNQTTDALKAFTACRSKDPKFVLDDANATLSLAQVAWRNGDAKGTLDLISGFDKRFQLHPEAIAKAYELAAKALLQGMNRADMAQAVLKTLEARYPDSESTKEVRWLLRDKTQPASI